MAPIERSTFFQVRMSSEEVEMLKAVSDAQGVSSSDVVRQLVRMAFEKLGTSPLPDRIRLMRDRVATEHAMYVGRLTARGEDLPKPTARRLRAEVSQVIELARTPRREDVLEAVKDYQTALNRCVDGNDTVVAACKRMARSFNKLRASLEDWEDEAGV